MTYKVFARTWWKYNKNWPDGLEPCMGRKTTLKARCKTEAEARDICRVYNLNHDPGRLSRKAEYREN